MAELRAGTSGYAYAEWKGSFYPKTLPPKKMLAYYSRQFPTVEINYTFYRMPSARILEGWAEQVPPGFQFVLKANQDITHVKRLRNCEPALQRFLEAASTLASEGRLGPILVQLPPSFRIDLTVLEEFLKLRPPAFRFALEVRHPTWQNEETYSLLRLHQTALCLAETDQEEPPELLTADFTYVRLRRTNYTNKRLDAWRERFTAWQAKGIDVYAFCKHEQAGRAPAYARRLLSPSL